MHGNEMTRRAILQLNVNDYYQQSASSPTHVCKPSPKQRPTWPA